MKNNDINIYRGFKIIKINPESGSAFSFCAEKESLKERFYSHNLNNMHEQIDDYIKNKKLENEEFFENILQEAESIIFKRESEKERQYGPFNESIEKAAEFADLLCADPNIIITPEIVFKCLIGLKMSRIAYNNKRDTFLDAIGYLAAFENYVNNK